MPHIIDNKVWHDDQKIGWIDGIHVRTNDNAKLGYFENNTIYDENGHKVAYIEYNELKYENGHPPISLEQINEIFHGENSILAKCAVHVLMEV